MIVLNQYISIDNEYFYNKNLIAKNTIMINDYFNEEGKPIKYNVFIEKNGNIIPFFKYMAMIDAIPTKWRKVLKTHKLNENCCDINEMPYCQVSETNVKNIFMVSSRELYWELINHTPLQPSCINAWNQRLPTEIDKSTWEKLFILPFRCTQNINVKEVQVKILHRFYASKSLIAKWDNETSDICMFCKIEIANIFHTFTGCTYVKQFWRDIENWLQPILSLYTAKLDATNMLFGIVPYTMGNHCINHCLMYCRYYIHFESINNVTPFKALLISKDITRMY